MHLPHEVYTSSVSAEFTAAHGIYVEANGSIAWVPEKLAKCEGDDQKHPVWLTLSPLAKKYRSAYRRRQLPQEDFEQLEEIGFAWCKNEEKWEKVVVSALVAYKEINGNLEVPRRFEVPLCSPWPEHLWGMELGNTADGIRSPERLKS